jgi:hypothetical protein
MAVIEDYAKFSNAEKETDRLAALGALAGAEPSRMRDFAMWYAMLQIPARKEHARLASGVKMSARPGASWALLSALIQEADHETVGDAINAMTFSRNRALAHRLFPLTFAPEKPQRVLYCVARFSEEAFDRSLAHRLPAGFDTDASDAMQARTLNALFRHGVREERAIQVASELVASHVGATNLDRKASVAAILYLCFAGNLEDVQKLVAVRDSITIPELRRLLTWGLQEITSLGRGEFTAEDAVVFFERAWLHNEPNFSGYGCFAQKELLAGFEKFLQRQAPNDRSRVVRLVLNLGNADCINRVAVHPTFGIEKAMAEKDAVSLECWREFCPTHAAEFVKIVKNVDYYSSWHKENPVLLFGLMNVSDWVSANGAGKVNPWQLQYEKVLLADVPAAIDIFCAQFLSFEREFFATPNPLEAGDARVKDVFGLLLFNLEKLVKAVPAAKSTVSMKQFSETMYSLWVSSLLPALYRADLVKQVAVPQQTWVPVAVGVTSSQWDTESRRAFALGLLEGLDAPVQDFNSSQNEYVLQVSGYLLSLLLTAELLPHDVAFFAKFGMIVNKIQAILDALQEHGEDAADADDDVADWSGHVAADKPVARWNVIAQVCGRSSFSGEEIHNYEQVLKESIRVAPHVEKRWVIRALVKLNTDDAIKAILYQAFQHVDVEFVGHTIRELLHSKHPRAQQALIRAIGRSTVSDDLKLLILDEMALENPIEVMRELKTLELLKLPQHIDEAIRDAVGRVAALIDKSEVQMVEASAPPASIQNVDSIVHDLLPSCEGLSVDTRSALRTAEMILIQSQSWGKDAVDLSPIVNMHCKAVELSLREILEPWTDSLMRKGLLSRKLDIIGYARPIPEKMQIFEDYLASLPVIKTIPYFSRFKLRKMLRAICLFRPGKRFTLDGPKAFALMLLVASRKQCQFGLANIFDAGFKSDIELFEFIKLVHSLQDSRNRAVHEGLTWEAKDDIESMKSQAYRIIEITQRTGMYLKDHVGDLGGVGA